MSNTLDEVLNIMGNNRTNYIVERHFWKCSSLISKDIPSSQNYDDKPRRSLQVINAAVNDTDGSEIDTLVDSPINLALYYSLVLRSDHSAKSRQVMAGIL